MILNLIDQLTLLALDDEKGTLIPDAMVFSYALAGAVVEELALSGRIQLSEKKIIVADKTPLEDPVIDPWFDKMKNASKPKSMKSWIEQIGNKGGQIKKDTIEKLIARGILARKENKILWIFNSERYPASDQRPENQLRRRLYDIVINHHHPDTGEVMLLNLISACSLGKEVFGKEHTATFKKRLKSMNDDDSIAGKITLSVKEICETINALLVIMIATTVTTSAIHH